MNVLPSNHLQAPDDEDQYHRENIETGHDCISEDVAIQENITGKSVAISSASDRRKMHPERLMQDGFGLSSPKLKAKRRKADTIEVHGGRIIRSTGRKDRHSKVCTARGTRDRRVRLSPKTAISFYDVQDRLGCDRPSKAIDWLMKEAKAAIDALDEHPPAATNVAEIHGPPDCKNQPMLKTERGINIQSLEHLTDGISPIGAFTEGAAPSSSTEFQAYLNDDFRSYISRREAGEDYQEQLLSAPLTTPSEILDTNYSEISGLQRIFPWNYSSVNGSLPLHFPAAVDIGHGHMFCERESLQSSHSRITNYSPQFPGHVSFSNEELLNFTAAATFKENEKDNIPVSSKSSSTAAFLHYEE